MMYYGILRNGEIFVEDKLSRDDIIIFNVEDRMEANIMALEANIYSKLTKQFMANSCENLITRI